jgi:trehalose 6-phosphate phosphatase
VVNLLPVGGPHKGLALLDYVARKNLKCAFYVGDDDTDEDVFSMPDPRIIGVRVGYKKTSQAKFYIRRQGEIVRLLRTIIQYHKNSPKNEFASV